MKIGYRHSALLVLLLAPFAYAMFFAFPVGDDFVRALVADGLFDWRGGLRDLAMHWMRWSGRYTHHFLVVFLGDAVMTRAGYGAVCLGAFALYGVALAGMFRQLAAAARPPETLFLALLSLLALASGHEALNLTHYVVTDALGLAIGNAMVLMFVYALVRLWHLPAVRRRDMAFALFCAVFAIGCYEHAAIATVVAAALALWMAGRARHPRLAGFRLVLGVAIAFLLLSFLAPGNFNRQDLRAVSWARIAEQLALAGGDWAPIALSALFTHFALLALFLGIAVAPRARAGLRPIAARALAVAGLFAFVAVSAGIVLVHALSDVRVTATPKLPASVHLLGGAVLAFVAIACGEPLRARLRRVPVALPALLVFIVFAASSNTVSTLRSIATGQLDDFAEGMTRRLRVLAAARGDEVRLAPLRACPFPACVGEPVPARTDVWPSAYIARLYGQRSVVTAPDDVDRAYASLRSRPAVAWTRIPGSGMESAVAALDPGPNATYRDGWLFLRGTPPAPRSPVGVVVVPKAPSGYLPAAFEAGQRESLFGGPSFAITAQHAFFGRVRQPRLASPAGGSEAPAILAAPLGLADPSNVAAIFVSLDGSTYHRLPGTPH